MFWIILFTSFAVFASAADVATTMICLNMPGAYEANSLIYGEHPSDARLIAIAVMALGIAFGLSVLCLHYGSNLPTALVVLAILGGIRTFGAVNNWRLIKRHG